MLWDNSALLVLFIVTPPSWETHLPSMGLHVSAPAWSLVNDTNDAAPWPKIIGASISTWIRFSCEFIVSKKPPCVDGSVACKPVEILAHCKLLILCWLERRLGKKERAVWERGKKERERGKRNRKRERQRKEREEGNDKTSCLESLYSSTSCSQGLAESFSLYSVLYHCVLMIDSLLLFLLLFVGCFLVCLLMLMFWEIIWKERGQYPLGFPGSSEGKVSACNAWDRGSIPGLGRTPGEGNGNSL